MKFKLPSNLIWPIVVLIVVFGAFWLKPWQTKTADTISVTANGKAEVTPNVAQITATVESKNPNLDEARKENEQKVSSLIAGLKNLGITEKDIKTQQVTGGQGYEIQGAPEPLIYPPLRPKQTNQFSTSLEVTIHDLTKADEVIGALTAGGATNLYGPSLTIGDKELDEGKSQAREDAVSEARKKAEELAKLSGRKLGKAVKITEQGDFGYPVPILARGEADLQQKASQIQPGQSEVTINLSVDFALK